MKFAGAVMGLGVIAVLAIGCGGSDDAGATQEQVCEAGQSLESTVSALSALVVSGDPGRMMDSVAEQPDDLQAAVEAVEEQLGALADAASDDVVDEIDEATAALNDFTAAVATLGADLSVEYAVAAQDAFAMVDTAAQLVYTDMSGCP